MGLNAPEARVDGLHAVVHHRRPSDWFRVVGLGFWFRVSGLSFRVEVSGFGCGVYGIRVRGLGF